ncbi:hypothetical protein VaNZ11_013606, partial [Volvox africanus]
MRTLLIDNYDSYTYNLYQLIAEVNGELPVVYHNDKITLEQISSMVKAGTVQSIVISPGPGTPHKSSDVGVCIDLLQQLPEVPILGICLGHQALALAHGASVITAPEPVHGRLSRLRHKGHALYKDIPSGDGFEVVRYHSLVVDERSLPECLEAVCWTTGGHSAVKLARDTAAEPYAANPVESHVGERPDVYHPDQQLQQHEGTSGCGCLLMGIVHRSRPHFGVQFHPESVATRYGIALLRNFRDLVAEHIKRRFGSEAAQLPPLIHLRDIVGPPGRTTLSGLPPWPAPEHQCGATLRLLWSRLAGLLHRLPGGSQALFELLYGWANDTFWLDSAAADRGRFSYMGGRGGQLWRKLTYKLPLPTSTAAAHQPTSQPASQFEAQPSRGDGVNDRRQLPSLDSEDQPTGAPHNTDNDGASSSSTAGACSFSYELSPTMGPSSCTTASTAAAQSAPHPACTTALGGGTVSVEKPDGYVVRMAAPSGFLGFLEGLLERQRLLVEPEAAAQLPFNFWGGLVGYLGYELKAECGGSNVHTSTTPDAVMYLADRVVAVDNATGDVFLLALYDNWSCGHAAVDAEPEGAGRSPGSAGCTCTIAGTLKVEAQAWLEETERILEAAVEQLKANSRRETASASAAAPSPSSASTAPSYPSGWQCDRRLRPEASCDAASSFVHLPGACDRVGPETEGVCDICAELRVTDQLDAPGPCRPPPSQHQWLPQMSASTSTSLRLSAAVGNGCTAGQEGLGLQVTMDAAAACPSSALLDGKVVPFVLAHSRRAYLRNIAACHAALHAGESYEVCLTTGLTRTAAPNPAQLYRTLRQLNPAPYAAWMQCGAEGPTICCSSPERFLRGDRCGLLEARPIKGTAARVPSDPVADAASAAELARSEKERAENLMIVDLLRNDLGRVCQVGTVHVPGLMEIESYATVHQMVSTVRGVRRAGMSIIDCIRAAFPGGSMTGAPKVRTMQIIDVLEDRPRGIYSGSIGFISFNDTFDLNIVIRTAIIEDLAPDSARKPDAVAPGRTISTAEAHLVGTQQHTPMRRMMTIGA